MILISHRGNINGKIEEYENYPPYIDSAIKQGYDVEVDIWFVNDEWWLGHDEPHYKISTEWLEERQDKLWMHCKNIGAVEWFNMLNSYHYFWHEGDTLTLTSMNVIWAYPGKQPIKGSIAVMPEIHNDDLTACAGICSDYINNYK